jgi:hypothetical protein
METRERIDERDDELQDLRERYNRYCTALAFGGGAGSGERLLQEIQVLSQRILAAEARQARSAEDAPSAPPAMPAATAAIHQAASPARASNVIAFRVKMKGTADQRPGYLPDFTTLPSRPGDARPASKPVVQAGPAVAAVPEPIEGLRDAVVAQGRAILVVSARCDQQQARLVQLEERLPVAHAGNDLSAEVAGLRQESENQRQQLVVVATAVHRLARLLASGSSSD